MQRRRAITVAAAAVALLSVGAVVAPPATADSALSREVRLGPTVTDVTDADGVAPVTEDAEPVTPQVELVELDEAVEVADAGDAASDEPVTESGAVIDERTGTTAGPSDAETPGSSDTGDPDSTGGTTALMSAPTPALAVVGVSWATGTAGADLEVSWRTQSASGWTPWQELHAEAEDAPDPADAGAGARDGTSPLAVIDATAVEIMMTSASGELPQDATLGVVDPGTSEGDDIDDATASASSGGAGTVLGGGAAGTTRVSPSITDVTAEVGVDATRPTIYSRAQWGADESMMTWDPSQGRVQGIDIHHTVNANDYTAAEVPAILRGIYAYHAQDWGRGWGDIGYNFLVDRFGRIWEGRYGGVTSAPIGAHATGLNSNMSGISLIGNFDITPVPSAMFTAVAKLAAWKLWLHGVTSPYGTITLDAGTFNRIAGHRDAKQTTCPGRYMYDRLPEMRSRIAGYIGSFSGRTLDRDVDGDGYPDLLTYANGVVGRVSTVDQGIWYRSALSTGFASNRTTTVGDVTGDGNPDIVRLTSSGVLQLLPGTATNRLGSPRTLATGWPTDRTIVGGADLSGDGRPDLLVRRGDGTLWVYRLGSGGALLSTTQFGTGSGWDAMDRITIAPDYLGGRETVILGENRNGRLYAYRLTASGGYKSRSVVTSSWSSMRMTTGVGDITGDGNGDVVAIDAQERMWLMPGSGSGGLYTSRREPLDVGRSRVSQILPIGYTTNKLSIWTMGTTNNLVVNRYATTVVAYRTTASTGIPMAVGDRPVVVGDWNLDGTADIVMVKKDGNVRLYLGQGGGRFASTSRLLATGFAKWEAIVGAGNLRGDGRTGLLTWDKQTGRIWYYPATTTGFFARVLVSDAADGMDYLVNAGRFTGPGVPDLLMRGADSKRLFVYDGNGPGLTLSPVAISSTSWGSRNSIIGVGDVTFDGKADLIYQTSAGAVMIARGDGTGSFAASYRVASRGAGASWLR